MDPSRSGSSSRFTTAPRAIAHAKNYGNRHIAGFGNGGIHPHPRTSTQPHSAPPSLFATHPQWLVRVCACELRVPTHTRTCRVGRVRSRVQFTSPSTPPLRNARNNVRLDAASIRHCVWHIACVGFQHPSCTAHRH